MINRLLTFALFLAVLLLLQLLLAPLVDVNGVRPDFLLVAALLAVLFLDRFYGLLAAFCIGILSDGLAAGTHCQPRPRLHVGCLVGRLVAPI
jgi:rod shape-determining protein MreD